MAEIDGIVGPNTWTELDDLDARKAAGSDGLSPELIEQICELAKNSAIANYGWRDRERAPRPRPIPLMRAQASYQC
jgi:hypothetical protein